MSKLLFYTLLVAILLSWAIGLFYYKESYYIHSLLVIAGLLLAFKYVYKLKVKRA